MKANTRLSPKPSAPVARVIFDDQTVLLAELSEETLSDVVASIKFPGAPPEFCLCAASRHDK
jgi:hypothetical protein